MKYSQESRLVAIVNVNFSTRIITPEALIPTSPNKRNFPLDTSREIKIKPL